MDKILVIDNYDSFTFNLVHYLEASGDFKVEVFRNDELSFGEVAKFNRIVLSPGPGLPQEAGRLKEIIQHFATSKNIFGVCLGQQAIAEVFGGKLKNPERVYHGVSTEMKVVDTNEPIFSELPEKFSVGRYHSWVIDNQYLPKELKVTAIDQEGEIMAIRHTEYNIAAVQFHPESILTQHGHKIISNWLNT